MDPERRDAASIWGGMEGPAAKEEPRAAMCMLAVVVRLMIWRGFLFLVVGWFYLFLSKRGLAVFSKFRDILHRVWFELPRYVVSMMIDVLQLEVRLMFKLCYVE